MVTGKSHKMKNIYSAVHVSPSIFLILKNFKPMTPWTLTKFCALNFSYLDYCMSNVHRSFCSFFCSNSKTYLSLGGAIIFQVHLGIHRSNTGDKLVYYSYYVEISLPIDVYSRPFVWTLIIFIQT